jgi:uncharacterized membrane protein
MLINKNDIEEPRKLRKWFLTGFLIGAVIVITIQILTKYLPQ